MTYSITVMVRDGQAEVEVAGKVPDGRYEVSGTPSAHGPEPSVRWTDPRNIIGSTAAAEAEGEVF